jgi:hypothetical protein
LTKIFKDNYDISVLGELVSFSEYLTDEEKIELTKAITKSEIRRGQNLRLLEYWR